MFKRVKRIVELSKLTPKELFDKTGIVFAKEPLGDGKAEFLGEGSHEEFTDAENDKKGFKGIFGL